MKIAHWMAAARPKTLPAALSPVMVGCALAAREGSFNWIPACCCAFFALLIQIATNFANDYFDFKKGTDNARRIGPTRAVAAGWISPPAMLAAALLCTALAILAGLALLPYGGNALLWIGAASAICAFAYTGGPFPLAYHGLGDLFVLIFFGWIAVAFTGFVQTQQHSLQAILMGTSIGCLSVNLLLINNYRDHDNDRDCGKRTTVVRFGLRYGRWQYRSCVMLSLISTLTTAFILKNPLLPIATFPLIAGWRIADALKTATDPSHFARMLKGTAGILLLHACLLSLLLLIG
jgi:1,4-dihydroxy-2-naphthoate octaprenyltransferase